MLRHGESRVEEMRGVKERGAGRPPEVNPLSDARRIRPRQRDHPKNTLTLPEHASHEFIRASRHEVIQLNSMLEINVT